MGTRSYIGAKTKKMQSRVKQFENRMEREIEQKDGLLQDIENTIDLKVMPMKHFKEVLVAAREYTLTYTDADSPVFAPLNFEIRQGDRIFLHGENGCGKSGLIISYINQDTAHLRGSIKDFCQKQNLDESLFCAILRQLDMDRVQFVKNMEEYSEGQKKKVLIAASLLTPAHLYIWDEPLNYIDVFSRMQIEKLILEYKPTMLIVKHDVRFREKIATETVLFSPG